MGRAPKDRGGRNRYGLDTYVLKAMPICRRLCSQTYVNPLPKGGIPLSSNDAEYYRERAIRERELAYAACDPRAAARHAELAGQYEAVLASDGRPTARILTADFQMRWASARRTAAFEVSRNYG